MAEIDNVELKKRSRRRLVGAGALALLAAIVLPMVMDQEPMTPVQDIQVTIPERDSDSGSVRPNAGRHAAAEPQLAPPPEEQAPGPVAAEPPRVAPEAATVRPALPTAPVLKPAEPLLRPPVPKPADALPKPEVRKAEVPKPEAPKPEAPKADTAKAAIQAPHPPTHPEDARAKDILEGKLAAAASAPPAAGDAFVVQIGAFSDAAKAASIVADLKKRGFAAYTEKVGAVTRVRVGPFRGRDDADRAAQRAKASGLGGTVMPR